MPATEPQRTTDQNAEHIPYAVRLCYAIGAIVFTLMVVSVVWQLPDFSSIGGIRPWANLLYSPHLIALSLLLTAAICARPFTSRIKLMIVGLVSFAFVLICFAVTMLVGFTYMNSIRI